MRQYKSGFERSPRLRSRRPIRNGGERTLALPLAASVYAVAQTYSTLAIPCFPYATVASDLLLSPWQMFRFWEIYVDPFESPNQYLERL
jgi:hypothetical protein